MRHNLGEVKTLRKIHLGRTELYVSKTAFGALPIQRITVEESDAILKRAFESGINFYDTANMYTDSEMKIGHALHHVRNQIVIATKSQLFDKEKILKNIDQSLKSLQTDYIDIFQFHNPAELPSEDIYEAVYKEKEKGKIRHIGISSHKINLAFDAVRSGLYETMQFPFSLLSQEKEIELVEECKRTDTGFIAMKAMAGGLINDSRASFGFMEQYDNVVPIYGIQKRSELEEFIALAKNPPLNDDDLKKRIEKSREGLSGDFCRSCGYCMPCPAQIDIPQSARISLLMTRSPSEPYLTKEFAQKMEKVNDCIECGECKSRCPYELDTPKLLKTELDRYHKLYNTLVPSP